MAPAGRNWEFAFAAVANRGCFEERSELQAFGPLRCQSNESLAYVNGGNGRNFEFSDRSLEGKEEDTSLTAEGPTPGVEGGGEEQVGRSEDDPPKFEDLKELLQKALKELEVARLNSTMFEEKAQSISELAIALKDEAAHARDDVDEAASAIEIIATEEMAVKEAVQKATMALSLAEARLQLAVRSWNTAKDSLSAAEPSVQGDPSGDAPSGPFCSLQAEEKEISAAESEIRECTLALANCEAELKRLQFQKMELQKEVDRLSEAAEEAQEKALEVDEDVANIMLLAEQAVAFELDATQRVHDAEIALQKVKKMTTIVDTPDASASVEAPLTQKQVSSDEPREEEEKASDGAIADVDIIGGDGVLDGLTSLDVRQSDPTDPNIEQSKLLDESHNDHGNKVLDVESFKEVEVEADNVKAGAFQVKKQETQKDLTKDSSAALNSHKALLKKSSRFFSASFFSFEVDGTGFTPASVFHGVVTAVKEHMPKLVVGALLLGVGAVFVSNRLERSFPLLQQTDAITTGIEEVTSTAKPLVREIRRFPKRMKKLIEMIPHQELNEEEASLFDMLWLLLASVIFVPIFQKIPGGSPVLGYLAAGILIGPYGLSIIRHVHGTKAVAEFGVVFLLFNIGLEVLVTAAVVGLVSHYFAGLSGPAAIVVGNGLALSSTAVVLQVLQERGESTSRHGRATFSVLLFQVGFQAIAEALGLAAVKAIVAIAAIIAGGRLLLRPIYKQIAENQNAEIFSANTLLVILGTSLLTARAGLSMALGAFLAGLLLAETEFSLQVESDIAPYRGLLLGLFFMTVGMSIDPKLLVSNYPVILGALSLLIGGKTILVAFVGKLFGISTIAAIRVGLLLAPGGEFAFVAFGEAVNQAIMSPQLSSLLFLVVGISMALTPWLAAGGQLIASKFEQHDVRSLSPVESEIIAQLLSERLIPFVALDVRSDRVALGRALDLPVYFGDAGSREVLHKVGAERACAAAITLDTPGANYRTVWALSKYFPNVKTFVRAHDVDHGLNLEKAGATAVVPETLEPSLQLAAAVLAQAKLPMSEIATTINEFRSRHLSELTEEADQICEESGSSLGYGFSGVMTKPKPQYRIIDIFSAPYQIVDLVDIDLGNFDWDSQDRMGQILEPKHIGRR
ncbi:K(+) efflux antiporter 2, chloroplastic [Asimina triloba]